MAKALLLACGNTLRGDDGVGWWIGGEVEQNPPVPDLEVILTHQLLPEHAEQVSRADTVVFVDCSAVTAAGSVAVVPIGAAEKIPRLLTHHLDPASLLRLAADLYGRAPATAFLVTVGGQDFGLADGLSKAVQESVPRAVEAVDQILFARKVELRP